MGDTTHANHYRDIDFRAEPHKYKIGRGEQGVLLAEQSARIFYEYYQKAKGDAGYKGLNQNWQNNK